MDSSEALKYHFKTFRVAGVWPKEAPKHSLFYHSWTVVVFILLGLLFPVSQILNIFFAGSVTEMVDRSVITSSVVVVVVKGMALYSTRKGLNEFFEIIKGLDRGIHDDLHIQQMNKTIKIGHQLYFSYLYPYISTCVLLVYQTIYSKPESRMWSSTYAYPFEWAQRSDVYVCGLFAHGIANTCIVMFAVAADTYGVVMLQILSTHIDILQEQLKCLGMPAQLSAVENFDKLISCCKSYESILRCSKLLESVLGLTLFAQFCVSGVVLCTSAYQLTMISLENFSKLSFVIVYFMCMMTEIFVPCFFGSVAWDKSRLIGWKIYESNWIRQNKQYKQAMCLFLQRSANPIHITVNKVLFLDLSTFLKILKTTYSLFALLKKV